MSAGSTGGSGDERGRHLRELLDASDASQALLTGDGVIIAANAAFAAPFGVDAAQLPGRSVFAFLPADLAAHRRSRLEEAVKTGEPLDFEDERGGRWWRHRLRPIRDAGGAVARVAVHAEDVTALVAAEREHRERESRQRNLYDAMTELFVLHELVRDAGGRPVDYRIVDCNPAFTKITGIAREQAVGALASALYGSGSAPYLEIYAEVATSGKPARFEVYFEPMRKHFRIIAFPTAGGFATVADDITEQKRAEDRLRDRESTIRQVAEAVSEVLWVRSLSLGRITYVNPAYERVWGRPARELLTNPATYLEQVHPDDLGRVRDAAAAASKGRMVREEYRIVRRDGSVRWISARTFPLLDAQGQADRMAGVAEDVTELRQKEEALRAMQSLLDAVIERLSGKTGGDLFQAVARLIAEKVPGSHAIAGRIAADGERLQLLAMHGPGGPLAATEALDLADTPCERTIRQNVGFYPARLRRIFPDAPYLAAIGAESYAGISLHGSEGRPLGLLAVLANRPMAAGEREPIVFLLRLLALRASSELERLVTAEHSPGLPRTGPT